MQIKNYFYNALASSGFNFIINWKNVFEIQYEFCKGYLVYNSDTLNVQSYFPY